MTTLGRPCVVTTVEQLRQALAPLRQAGKRIGLVPTMGALHDGHLSLARASAAECDSTVATIFVNPTQFGPNEDLAKYPRTLEADLDGLATCGVQLVFAPPGEEVYARGHATWVDVESITRRWEGEHRPGHFRGVTTIVLKLFNMVGADVAYFGQKDFQQALVIQRMVEELNLPIAIRVCPTVRESDGLAMSSRNAYLSADARRRAVVLWQSLCLAQDLVAGGQRSAAAIIARMREKITAAGGVIDYIALADPRTLEPVDEIRSPTLAALAVRIDQTRLIDNCLLEPK